MHSLNARNPDVAFTSSASHWRPTDEYYQMVMNLAKPGGEIEVSSDERAVVDYINQIVKWSTACFEYMGIQTSVDAHNYHMLFGIMTECGELLDPLKKIYIYETEPTPEMLTNIEEELGDLMFYIYGLMPVSDLFSDLFTVQMTNNIKDTLNLVISLLGFDPENVMKANQDKLGKRYSEGSYSKDQAIARADKEDDGYIDKPWFTQHQD